MVESSSTRAPPPTAVTVPLRFPDGYETSAQVFTLHGLLDGTEHLALGLGDWRGALELGSPPLVRPHSECLTAHTLALPLAG